MTVTNKKPILEQCYDYVDYLAPHLVRVNPDLRKEMALEFYHELINSI